MDYNVMMKTNRNRNRNPRESLVRASAVRLEYRGKVVDGIDDKPTLRKEEKSASSLKSTLSRRTIKNTHNMQRGKTPYYPAITNNESAGGSHGFLRLQTMGLNGPELSQDDSMKIEDSLSSIVLKTLSKKSLCDFELVGKDGVSVKAPSYLLAAHSDVFESMFFSEPPNTSEKATPFISSRVEIAFAERDAINAAMHYLATRTLPNGLDKEEATEFSMRTLCQLYHFGTMFKIHSLWSQAYRTARLLMNKNPHLVCAAFDECTMISKYLSKDVCVTRPLDEIRSYALEFMRDTPLETLLAGGTLFLSKQSIEDVICDYNMDVNEHTMFCILNTWVNQDKRNIETGKALVSHINLSYIKPDRLNDEVKRCGFVELSDVEAALKEIEDVSANKSPAEKEHVLVEGAGDDDINGIYVRLDDDIGLGSDEVIFVKEATEEEDCSDYGLYLLKSSWVIAPCFDYSNVLYTSADSVDSAISTHVQPPKLGWKTVVGNGAPPICTWNPIKKDNAKEKGKGYVAPNLQDSFTFSDIADGDHDDGQRRLTLATMLYLPTDDDHEDSYHDIDVRSTLRRLNSL